MGLKNLIFLGFMTVNRSSNFVKIIEALRLNRYAVRNEERGGGFTLTHKVV